MRSDWTFDQLRACAVTGWLVALITSGAILFEERRTMNALVTTGCVLMIVISAGATFRPRRYQPDR